MLARKSLAGHLGVNILEEAPRWGQEPNARELPLKPEKLALFGPISREF